MKQKQADRIIGYYEGNSVIKPIFGNLSPEEFSKKYPGRTAVLPEHLADDDDYIPAEDDEEEVDFI